MKKYRYLMAFLLPITILATYIICIGGNLNSLFISDLREQYIFLFDYFKEVLNGDKSLFYSYSVGLGQGMIGTYAYYLASPFNLLLFFVPENYIMDFISILILIKIGLCGLTMFIYLENSNKNDYYINIMFSLCYALMSFNIMYYFNIMWLDAIYLTPLIILGIDKIVLENKSKLYIVTLFLCIISQYYMGFIVCLFCIIYFIYKSISCNNLNKKVIKKFIFSSLIAGLLTSFLTIPTLLDLFNVYRENNANEMIFLGKLSNLLISLGLKQSVNHMEFRFPNIYCGLINIVLCINYLIYEKDKRKKIPTLLVIIFFIASILLDFLIIIWHGGSSPFGFLYRFCFLVSFFLIIISANHYNSYTPFNKKKIFVIITIYTLLLILGYFLYGASYFNYTLIILNVIIMIFNIILLNINKLHKNNINIIGIIIFVILELFINLKLSFTINESLREDSKTILNNNRLKLYDLINDIDSNSVRIDGKAIYYDDEKIMIDKGNTELFLSSNNKQMFSFLNNCGYYVISPSTSKNSVNYVINSLLGIKYWYGDGANEKIYQYFDSLNFEDNEISIFINDYALSLGYIIDNKNFVSEYNNPFEYQNNFVKAISGEEIFFKYSSKIKENNEYTLSLNDSDNIYLYVPIKTEDSVNNIYINVYINNELVLSQKNVLEDIISIPNNYKNEKVDIRIEYLNNINHITSIPEVYFYYDNYEKNIKILSKLKENQLENIEIIKHKFIGTIDVKHDSSIMLLTIPYDDDFVIYVDGKKTKYSKLYESFIGLELSNGKHKIEIIYKPKGIKLGMIISFSTLLLAILYLRRDENEES